MNLDEKLLAILKKKTSVNRKASELRVLVSDEKIELAKRLWNVEQTHGPKWVELIKKEALFEKRDFGKEPEDHE